VVRVAWLSGRQLWYTRQVGNSPTHANSDGAYVGGRTLSLGGAAPPAAAVAWPYPPCPGDQPEGNPFDDSSHARRTMRHYTADAVDPAEESDSDMSDHLVFGEGDACTSAASSTGAPSPTGTSVEKVFDFENVSSSLAAAAVAASPSRFAVAPANPAEQAGASGGELGELSIGLKQRGGANNNLEVVLESGRPPRPPSSCERKAGSSRRSLEQVEAMAIAAGGSGQGSGGVGQAAAAAAGGGAGKKNASLCQADRAL